MKIKEYTIEIDGKKLTAQFSDLADQADGSVIVRYGNTVVLATAVMSKQAKEGSDFFPLTVDYEEKFYASGQILGSRFVRREGRPTDEAILSGRIVDRTIRPLFDPRMRHEVQVVITVLSIDEDDPDVFAVLAASLALGTSHIPWNGPVSSVRVGKTSAGFSINPSYAIRHKSDYSLDMILCGRNNNINMIEVGSKEALNNEITDGFRTGLIEIERLQEFQQDIIAEIGKEKMAISFPPPKKEITELFEQEIRSKFADHIFAGAGHASIERLKKEWLELSSARYPDDSKSSADVYFEEEINTLLHSEAVKSGRRPDGRGVDEVRKLFGQAGGVSPVLHGSGIFYRGGTHVLSALTLGSPSDSQIIDSMESREEKRFMHHYNFPPFSSGETGRMGGTNRRMIGHGALAEKALLPILPAKETFPYTIRIVSESMASNGSTSMASVCASSLALMDAGVPIKAPVAGIAIGLMLTNEREYKILVDIQGPEDHHGDMDFKVAGTRGGITAIQLDVKVDGIPLPILSEALEKAEKARHEILDVIEAAIPTPRSALSPRAPHILSLTIRPDQIGGVIGPGGKIVKGIKEKTGADSVIDFLTIVGKLKRKPRPIWVLRKVKNPSSEANHAFMLGLMCWLFVKERSMKFNMEKVPFAKIYIQHVSPDLLPGIIALRDQVKRQIRENLEKIKDQRH